MIPRLKKEEIQSVFLDWDIDKSPVLLATLVDNPSMVLVTYNGQRYFSSDLRRSGEEVLGTPDWISALNRVVRPAGGQEKNFLVALRTLAPCTLESVKICVRGSKVNSLSGQWQEAFIEIVLHRYVNSQIHFFDYGEIESRASYSTDAGHVSEVFHHSSHYVGKGEEFDVMINDASEGAAVRNERWATRWWSNKEKSEGGVYVPKFFHDREGRTYSDPIMVSPGCKCGRCQISASYGSLKYLVRSLITHVGGVSCSSGGSDLKARSRIHKTLMEEKKFECQTPQDYRVAQGIPSRSVTPTIIVPGVGFPKIAYGAGFLTGSPALEVMERVAFYGVDPSVFPMSTTQGTDHAVITIDYMSSSSGAHVVAKFFWLTTAPGPSFEPEGRVVGDYVCYVRKKVFRPPIKGSCVIDPWEGIRVPLAALPKVGKVPLVFKGQVSDPARALISRPRDVGFYTTTGSVYPASCVILGESYQFLTHVFGIPDSVGRYDSARKFTILKVFEYKNKGSYWSQKIATAPYDPDGTVGGSDLFSLIIDISGKKAHYFPLSFPFKDDYQW